MEQQNEFAWKIYTVCFHVGQMLFAGNKYLLLKRITVWDDRDWSLLGMATATAGGAACHRSQLQLAAAAMDLLSA